MPTYRQSKRGSETTDYRLLMPDTLLLTSDCGCWLVDEGKKMTNVIQFAKSGEVREVPDNLVKRLRDFEQWMRDPEAQKFTLSSDLFDEAADRIEKLYEYISVYEDQTNIMLMRIDELEAKLAEKEDD
jgi:hypothetical protein